MRKKMWVVSAGNHPAKNVNDGNSVYDFVIIIWL